MNLSMCPVATVDAAHFGYFTLGLLGSAHCIGTCGSSVISLAPAGGNWRKKSARLLQYGTGRLVAYGLIGCLAGLLGGALGALGYRTYIHVLFHMAAGSILVILGLQMLGVLNRWASAANSHGFTWLRQPIVFASGRPSLSAWSSVQNGFTTGLHPRALTLVAALYALSCNSPWHGLGVMTVFGLGTGPALLWLGASGFLIGPFIRMRVLAFTGALVLIFGLFSFWQTAPFTDHIPRSVNSALSYRYTPEDGSGSRATFVPADDQRTQSGE